MTGGAGLYAEFADPHAALAAARQLRERGYRQVDVHAPYEVPGAAEALALPRPQALPRAVALCGALGAIGAYAVQWYTNAWNYPLDVGGRPAHAAPAFVPITFEMGVLLGAFAALFGLIALARLGRLWQPAFALGGFERATIDRAWVAIDAGDPRLRDDSAAELEALGALRVARAEPP